MTRWARPFLLPVAAAALTVLTACAGTPAPAAAPPPPPNQHEGMDMSGDMSGMDMGGSNGGLELWAVQTGELGVVVTDGAGLLVYRSDKDSNSPPTTTCAGDCLQTWEPLLADPAKPPSLLGIDTDKIGGVARADGSTQLTLSGWPIYKHHGDRAGLQNAGANGTDGVWFAIKPNGEKAVAPPAG